LPQTILITGTSSGFGRLAAETLARQGHRVFAGMRDLSARNAGPAAELRELAARDGHALTVVEMDVLDDASTAAAVRAVLDRAGRVDVLVNNVGQGSWGLTEGFTAEQVEMLLATNVLGAVRANRAVLPAMRAQGSGLLVHVSSLIGRLVLPYMTPYSVAKHALEALAEGYHYELAALGIDSVIVEPQSHPTPGSLHKILFPQDTAAAGAYGALGARGDAMFADNDAMLTGPEAPDTQAVADAIAGLVAAPSGRRPLRTLVGGPMTQLVAPINEATATAQEQLLGFTGLTELTRAPAPS
jgi:NAD(P)-dependent dehydrogenase (short-subunit alcohol dehydrogenase family)